MSSDWQSALASLPRHHRSVDDLVARCTGIDGVAAVLLIGSLAAGRADAESDVDVLVVVEDERFGETWQRRQQLHGAALRAWDVGPRGLAGAHKWLSQDLVLTECLIAEPGGVRLAEPFVVLAGSEATVSELPRGDAAAVRRALQLLDKAESALASLPGDRRSVERRGDRSQ